MEIKRLKDYVDYLEMSLYLKINYLVMSKKEDEKKEFIGIISEKDLDPEKLNEVVLIDIMPILIKKLKEGTFDFEWNISDFYYNYEMLLQEPRLKDIYKKYLKLQELVGEKSGVKNPIYFDIVKNAIFTKDARYLPFVEELIKGKLYNPNKWGDFPSPNPFFRNFADNYLCLDNPELIMQVLLDERTDYNCLFNGSDELQCWIEYTEKKCKEKEPLPHQFFLLESVLKGNNVSILDALRHNGENYSYEKRGLILELVNLNIFQEYKDINKLLEFIVSDEYIKNQILISRYPSSTRDDAIETYIDFIHQKRGANVRKVDELRLLKLY